LTNPGDGDIFILKLDTNGNFGWAKRIGAGATDVGVDIVLDDQNNLFVTGQFGSTVDFDPGPGIFNVTSIGGGDIFVAKFDNSGDFVWVRTLGSGHVDSGLGIAVDSADDVYVTGEYGGELFSVPSDAFVWKLDSVGNSSWFKTFGGKGHDIGVDLAVDKAGN